MLQVQEKLLKKATGKVMNHIVRSEEWISESTDQEFAIAEHDQMTIIQRVVCSFCLIEVKRLQNSCMPRLR